MISLLFSVLSVLGVFSDAPRLSDDTSHVAYDIPRLYIDTDGGSSITSKEEYVDASFRLETYGIDGFEPIGSESEPDSLQIRGRGNWTWYGDFKKKPYRIKLRQKTPMLGMASSKHFLLLAHADDEMGFMRNAAGFELSRMMGLRYTPAFRPVELVLNGSYEGLYFLTENIRVEKNRLDIVEQQDYETDESKITGGWLVEIDNNRDEHQLDFSVEGTDLEWFWITHHTPEELSEVQREYLRNEFETILRAVYTADKQSEELADHVDIDVLARFYVIQEVLDHLEAFLGSCYLYKDLGEVRWKFGPVWDFGHAFNGYHDKNRFMWDNEDFPVSIIREIVKFPWFMDSVKTVWQEFYPDKAAMLETYLFDFKEQIKNAAARNYERWPEYGNADMDVRYQKVMDRYHEKVAFLASQWGDGSDAVYSVSDIGSRDVKIYNLSGREVVRPLKTGVYISSGRKIVYRR